MLAKHPRMLYDTLFLVGKICWQESKGVETCLRHQISEIGISLHYIQFQYRSIWVINIGFRPIERVYYRYRPRKLNIGQPLCRHPTPNNDCTGQTTDTQTDKWKILKTMFKLFVWLPSLCSNIKHWSKWCFSNVEVEYSLARGCSILTKLRLISVNDTSQYES